MTSTKLYVPIVTLSTKDNVNLTKQLKKDSKDLFTGINTNQKKKEKKQIMTMLQDFFLMLLFKELVNYLLLLLTILLMMIIEFKKTIIKLFPPKSRYNQLQCIN